jgi:hypothetical protein
MFADLHAVQEMFDALQEEAWRAHDAEVLRRFSFVHAKRNAEARERMAKLRASIEADPMRLQDFRARSNQAKRRYRERHAEQLRAKARERMRRVRAEKRSVDGPKARPHALAPLAPRSDLANES